MTRSVACGAWLQGGILAAVNEDNLPVCARPSIIEAQREAGAEWWIEEDSPEVGEDKSYKTPPTHRQNLLRGQIHCYECPFLVQCRRDSWGEPAHVWAGLTYSERYQAQASGRVIFTIPKIVNTRDDLSQRSVLRKRFLAGESIYEIAASMNRRPDVVWYHLRRVLIQARLDAEGSLWSEAPPPSLATGMTKTRFRHGAASSSGWVTNPPPGQGYSSFGGET